jgi:hypothetical protein
LLVEGGDADLANVGRPFQSERLLRQVFDGKTVTVPAEAALHVKTAHAPIAGHDVFDGAGQEVAIMGCPRGERRAVVEDELGPFFAAAIGLVERVELVPELEHLLFDRRKTHRLRKLFERALLGIHRKAGFSTSMPGEKKFAARRRRSLV